MASLKSASNPLSPSLPLPPAASTSTLPLPKALRHNKSFLALVHLLGLGSTGSSGPGSRSSDATRLESFSPCMDFQGNGDGGSAEGEAEGDGEEEEEEDGGGEVDEESLMWDAQTALIAHQPALALQHYTIAALPPYRSSPSCLALGNLLTRGSGLAPPASASASTLAEHRGSVDKGKGKARAYSFGPAPPSPTSPGSPGMDRRVSGADSIASPSSPSTSAVGRFMGFIWPSSSSTPVTDAIGQSPPERTYTDLVATGWTIPKEGKRAVRDVEGMGVAGGWYILGLGWIVDGQLDSRPQARAVSASASTPGRARCSRSPDIEAEDTEPTAANAGASRGSVNADADADDDGALTIGPKTKERIRRSPLIPPVDPVISTTPSPGLDADGNAESSSEGTILKTPPFEEDTPAAVKEDDEVTLKLIYDLLLPLLRLYRHGHIQSSDPVYLPPITSAQLPACLRPQGDLQKRRNVWYLGSTVVRKLLVLDILRAKQGGEERRSVGVRRRGVEVMARYILGMTCPPVESERQYRQILAIGHSGLEYPDELIRHAAKHLDIIRSPPASTPPLQSRSSASASRRKEYPFPVQTQPHRPGTDISSQLLQAPRRSFTSPAKIQRRVVKPQHQHQSSISSIKSNISTRITETSLKSVASVASLSDRLEGSSTATTTADLANARAVAAPASSKNTASEIGAVRNQAIDSLRRFQAQSAVDLTAAVTAEPQQSAAGDTWWPSLAGWSYMKAKEKLASPDPTSSPTSPTSPTSPSLRPGHAKEDSQRTIRARTPPEAPPLQTYAAPSNPTNTKLEAGKLGGTPSPTTTTFLTSNIPTIRTVASTPTFGSLRHPSTLAAEGQGHLTPRPTSRPFDHIHSHSDINTAVDPVLAAAELASTLTKRVKCGVCSVQGINFPECRRCGLVFCSRDCRVGSTKAGDGKRHVCGAWESRRGLMPPAPSGVNGMEGGYRLKGGQGKAARVDVRQVMAC